MQLLQVARLRAAELGALLLEARLVKDMQPVHNRQLRRERALCAWRLDDNPNVRPLTTLVSGADFEPTQFGQLYGVYRSRRQAQDALRAWIALIAYAVQIYCDFSGYSDIAIGLALLLGYRFLANFRQPYAAQSLRDFWKRWLISSKASSSAAR